MAKTKKVSEVDETEETKTKKKRKKSESSTEEAPKKKKKKVEKSTKKKIQEKKKTLKEEKELIEEMDNTLSLKKEIELPEDYYPYCSYDEEIKAIKLDLEAMFGRDDISYANSFALTRRNYHSLAPQIVYDYNMILNAPECDDFIYYVMEVKANIVEIKEAYLEQEKGFIVKKKMTDFEKKAKMVLDKEDRLFLIEKVNTITDLDYLFDYISDFVEEHYELNLDAKIDVNEKNLEYAITDHINKTVLKTSIVARLLIPLINEINMNETEIYKLFTRVMNKFDGDTHLTKDKLYKFIELRVNRTKYSDSTIWDFLSTRAVDSTLFISELNRRILNEIVAKLEYNKSIVSYFDVIIRFKLKFLFTYNYNVNYKTIKTNDKEFDDKDKLESRLNNSDVYDRQINTLSIQMMCDAIEVNEDEYDLDYIANLSNPFTTKFLEIFYYDEGFQVILATKEQRAKLIVCMRETLLENGFEIIPELIMSNIDVTERKSTNRKKIDADIVQSQKYKKFEKEYKDINHLFISSNHPIMQLASIKGYNAVVSDGEEEFELDYNYKILISEILDLINYFIFV